MRDKRVHILIAEPSLIIRKGLLAVLFDVENVGVNISESDDIAALSKEIIKHNPQIVVVNPLHLGVMQPQQFITKNKSVKFIALQNYISTSEQLKNYDGVISVTDSMAQIEEVLEKLIRGNTPPKDDELSTREKEIVTSIALGKSNKEIADMLCISAHTVMTHRKNIAAKLKIHNSAGLTIYAIVNKLIDVGDVK